MSMALRYLDNSFNNSFMNKITLSYFLFLFQFTIFLTFNSYSQDYFPGFELLRLEKEENIDYDTNSYLILKSIVETVSKKIQSQQTYSQQQAINILKTIGNVLATEFKISYFSDNIPSYSKAISLKKFDCYEYTFTYLTIAIHLNIPLYAIISPEHISILWQDASNTIYWETTSNTIESVSHYVNWRNIPQVGLEKGVFLKKLNKNELIATIYNRLGYYHKNNYFKASDSYEKAIKLNPNDIYAYYNRGLALFRLQVYKEAVECYNKAIEIYPAYTEAYINRGNAKGKLKDYKSAILDYNKAIELNPDLAIAYFNRAITKGELQNYKEALEDFNKAIELKPDDAWAFYERGYIKFTLKDYDGAIKDCSKVIELQPNAGDAYGDRGRVKCFLGDIKGGCLDLKKAVDLGCIFANDLIKQYCE